MSERKNTELQLRVQEQEQELWQARLEVAQTRAKLEEWLENAPLLFTKDAQDKQNVGMNHAHGHGIDPSAQEKHVIINMKGIDELCRTRGEGIAWRGVNQKGFVCIYADDLLACKDEILRLRARVNELQAHDEVVRMACAETLTLVAGVRNGRVDIADLDLDLSHKHASQSVLESSTNEPTSEDNVLAALTKRTDTLLSLSHLASPSPSVGSRSPYLGHPFPRRLSPSPSPGTDNTNMSDGDLGGQADEVKVTPKPSSQYSEAAHMKVPLGSPVEIRTVHPRQEHTPTETSPKVTLCSTSLPVLNSSPATDSRHAHTPVHGVHKAYTPGSSQSKHTLHNGHIQSPLHATALSYTPLDTHKVYHTFAAVHSAHAMHTAQNGNSGHVQATTSPTTHVPSTRSHVPTHTNHMGPLSNGQLLGPAKGQQGGLLQGQQGGLLQGQLGGQSQLGGLANGQLGEGSEGQLSGVAHGGTGYGHHLENGTNRCIPFGNGDVGKDEGREGQYDMGDGVSPIIQYI